MDSEGLTTDHTWKWLTGQMSTCLHISLNLKGPCIITAVSSHSIQRSTGIAGPNWTTSLPP